MKIRDREADVLLFTSDVDRCLAGREATLGERVLARLWAAHLDRALAGGASPEASAMLALRAQWLVRCDLRRELAHTVRCIVEDSGKPLARRPALTAEAHQTAVRRHAEALTELADCLSAPAPVAAVGMARAFLLIMDATGPLYYPPPDDELGRRIQQAVLALDPVRTW